MVDFQKKIKFLLENLYDNDENRLTQDFIKYSSPTPQQLRSRKVAIMKWLHEKSLKTPYISKDYEKYAISKLKFKNGMQVFPFNAFDWKFSKFQQRLKMYQEDRKSKHISSEDYKYIYYYHEDSQDLVYFEISYEDDDVIELSSIHYAQMLHYTGYIERHIESSMLHFIVSNSDEMMFFSFSELDLKLDYGVYGLCLSKDYISKNPKSSLVLLSQKLLTTEKKTLFETKINNSNITIVNNKKRPTDVSFINNLSEHLRDLKECVDSYSSRGIFLNLFLKEFNLFYEKFNQFYNKYEYYFSYFSQSMIKMLYMLQKSDEKHHLQIVYTLKDLNKSLFNHEDSDSLEFYNLFITLSKENRMSFEFIIIIGEKIVINRKIREKFEKLEDAGVSLLFREKRDIQAYSTIVLVDNINLLAISGLKGEQRYKITRYQTEVAKLKKEYEIQKKHAKPLQTILNEKYPLNGVWYLYGNGSNNILHFATFLIDGDNIDITLNSHNNKKYEGVIYKAYGDTLLCTSLAIIKFRDDEKNPIIKIVSLSSDQHNGNGKPIILFAILSRTQIEKNDRDKLFSALVDREASPYNQASFKLSLSIDEVLRPLLFKYERVYNSEKLL